MTDNERLLALIGGDPNAMITLAPNNNNQNTESLKKRKFFNRDGGIFVLNPSAKAMEPAITQNTSSTSHTFEN